MIRQRQVRRVAMRHVRDAFREKRTLIGILLIPVIVVLLFTFQREELTSELVTQQKSTHTVAVQGAQNAPAFVRFLRAHRLKLVPVPDARASLRDRKYPVGIVIPPYFDDKVGELGQARVEVVSGERSLRSQLAQSSTVEAIQAYGRALLVQRLEHAGLPGSAADPITISAVDVTSARERAGSLLGEILPFMLIAQVVGLMSGIATDVTVGEKERRTVEAMLASPLSRREIVAGKWLVTAGIGMIAGAITLVATILSLRMSTSADLGGSLHLPLKGIGLAAVAMIAVTFVMSSIQIAIGFFARSAQQAGVFLTPLVFFAFVPLFFFQSRSGTGIGAPMYAIPVVGPALLIRYGLSETANAIALPIVVASSALYAALGITLADRFFHSERALLRAGG